VEYAKSDRSRCVKCGSQVLKSEIRIGQQYDRDHSSYRWYHLECYQYAKNFPKTAKTAEDFLFGYEQISSIDRKRVARAMEKAIYHRDHGGAHPANHHHAREDSDDDDDDENEVDDEEEVAKIKTTKKKSTNHHTMKHKTAKEKETEEKEKEKEKEKEDIPVDFYSPAINYDYGIPSSSSSTFSNENNGFIGFGTYPDPLENCFLDKENDTSFLNTTTPTHQVFASSPLKVITAKGGYPSYSSSTPSSSPQDLQSFLLGFAHRLPRRHIDWLSHPTTHADKVKRAVEAAQVVYEVDGDEEDLIDTLERVYATLGGH